MDIHHIALKVRDLERCERFYTEVLKLKVTARHSDDAGTPRSVWLDCDGVILMLERCAEKCAASAEKNFGWYLMALRIPQTEREAWRLRLQTFGIALADESAHSLYFFDPEGNRLALSHYPDVQ